MHEYNSAPKLDGGRTSRWHAAERLWYDRIVFSPRKIGPIDARTGCNSSLGDLMPALAV